MDDNARIDMGQKPRMVSIWSLVGLVLSVYGFLVTGTGVAYLFGSPPSTVLGHLNPCLWWGGIMLAAGIAFLIGPHLRRNRD